MAAGLASSSRSGHSGQRCGERREMGRSGYGYFLKFRDFAFNRERQVLAFDKRPFNSGLAISPDGRWCLYTQVDQCDTDIMLVEDFH